ncbi:MAG: ABC transporter ATP-binding protein [Solibacillus isronensis]
MITELKNIKKSFGSTDVLKGIDLTIENGEFVAIVGPSGCGKTTLLKILAGFERPTSGELLMDDALMNQVPPEQRNISLVFQSFALWPHMKVKEQVAFPLKHHRFVSEAFKKQPDVRVEEMLSAMSMSHLADRYPHELSGGQKQRVAIARALSPAPALILMDEPLSSLDAKLRFELRYEIQKIHRQFKKAIVYVTHDQGEALAMADKIVVMNAGKIEQIGTPQEIYYYPETPFVADFVGKANLLEGTWDNDRFSPALSSEVSWHFPKVSTYFKQAGLCPLRPEQLKITADDRHGIEVEIQNIQFQGREMIYTALANETQLTIVSDADTRIQIGERLLVGT